MYVKTIAEGGTGEISEKKSRFIADVFYVSSQEEAAGYIETVKKRYNGARHHCWAYVITGSMDKERFSDDGEPAGTAGRPILDVIKGAGLKNVLIVVTRYFGGILLGTGGLARAYTMAAREGLAHSRTASAAYGFLLRIKTGYAALKKIEYILNQRNIPVISAAYTDTADLTAFVSKEEEHGVIKQIAEITGGQAEIKREKEYFKIYDEKRRSTQW